MHPTRTNDPLLRGILDTPDEEFRQGIEQLIAEHARPVVNGILAARQARDAGKARELHDEVILRLIERLHDLRRRGDRASIADFRGYVATVTYNALAEHHRLASRGPRPLQPGQEALPLAGLPDPRADPAMSFEWRTRLRDLWQDIGQLPVRQRAALLLNLRDEQGHGAISLLPATGTASRREIAALLEMPAARLAEIWNRLPLDDRAIGELLGATRQQVINLRKAARERLARRMRRRGE
jgi:RNA polymerase sigma factor (sigma-70 family)